MALPPVLPTAMPNVAATARFAPDAATGPSGPVLFARYAFGPNRLGLCGPEDWLALLQAGAAQGDDRELRHLAGGFEGAYPYLELIAAEAGLADPLARPVVEAYWLGTDLIRSVRPSALAVSLDARFRSRVTGSTWTWLAGKPDAGARPVHAFHVLDIFPRIGLMRGGPVEDALTIMDACRIRWGRVLEVCGPELVVSSRHLVLNAGHLELGAPRVERVTRWMDGIGFITGVDAGDIVSIHWDWACDRLDGRQLAALVRSTQRQMVIANQTI